MDLRSGQPVQLRIVRASLENEEDCSEVAIYLVHEIEEIGNNFEIELQTEVSQDDSDDCIHGLSYDKAIQMVTSHEQFEIRAFSYWDSDRATEF